MYRFGVPFKFYLILLVFLVIAQLTKAQVPINEGKMKSQLIVKLINQVDWPQNKDTVIIGLLGDDLNFQKNLMKLHRETKKEVKMATDLKKCDIIYVPVNGMAFLSENAFKKALVITSEKSDAPMYFDYHEGSMLLKTANITEVSKKGLARQFQLIVP